MPYYIFNSQGKCVASCDFEPNVEDCATRGEVVVETDIISENLQLELVEGDVRKIVPVVVEKTLDELKKLKLKEVNTSCENELAAITNSFPKAEQLSWERQISEATKYQTDETYVPPMLTVIADARGIELSVLAGKVLEKAEQYALISAAAFGKRQALEDAIDAATSKEELELIVW